MKTWKRLCSKDAQNGCDLKFTGGFLKGSGISVLCVLLPLASASQGRLVCTAVLPCSQVAVSLLWCSSVTDAQGAEALWTQWGKKSELPDQDLLYHTAKERKSVFYREPVLSLLNGNIKLLGPTLYGLRMDWAQVQITCHFHNYFTYRNSFSSLEISPWVQKSTSVLS